MHTASCCVCGIAYIAQLQFIRKLRISVWHAVRHNTVCFRTMLCVVGQFMWRWMQSTVRYQLQHCRVLLTYYPSYSDISLLRSSLLFRIPCYGRPVSPCYGRPVSPSILLTLDYYRWSASHLLVWIYVSIDITSDGHMTRVHWLQYHRCSLSLPLPLT